MTGPRSRRLFSAAAFCSWMLATAASAQPVAPVELDYWAGLMQRAGPSVQLDNNRDGSEDVVGYDIDRNAQLDAIEVDTNFDRFLETVLLIPSGPRGLFTQMFVDQNADGRIDFVYLDANRDGTFDIIAYADPQGGPYTYVNIGSATGTGSAPPRSAAPGVRMTPGDIQALSDKWQSEALRILSAPACVHSPNGCR